MGPRLLILVTAFAGLLASAQARPNLFGSTETIVGANPEADAGTSVDSTERAAYQKCAAKDQCIVPMPEEQVKGIAAAVCKGMDDRSTDFVQEYFLPNGYLTIVRTEDSGIRTLRRFAGNVTIVLALQDIFVESGTDTRHTTFSLEMYEYPIAWIKASTQSETEAQSFDLVLILEQNKVKYAFVMTNDPKSNLLVGSVSVNTRQILTKDLFKKLDENKIEEMLGLFAENAKVWFIGRLAVDSSQNKVFTKTKDDLRKVIQNYVEARNCDTKTSLVVDQEDPDMFLLTGYIRNKANDELVGTFVVTLAFKQVDNVVQVSDAVMAISYGEKVEKHLFFQ